MPSDSGDNGRNTASRVYPKKKFGQHFLSDKNIIGKIVRAAEIREGDHVLEIGPGPGALTEGLLSAGAAVVAVEVDPRLALLLRERFPGHMDCGRLEVVEGDALKLSFLELARGRGVRFKAVSNLPYNISGAVLAKFLNERSAFTLLVLMFQKEVARRLVAGPGTKEYGIPTVFARVYTDVSVEFDVSRNIFTPRPKVDSSVVRLRVLDSPRVAVEDPEFFAKVVKAAFGTRRKTLLNSLASTGLKRDGLLKALLTSGIDPGRRGETLGLDEFSRLAIELRRFKET